MLMWAVPSPLGAAAHHFTTHVLAGAHAPWHGCMRHLLTAGARLHAVDALAASQPGGRSAGCSSLARAPQLRQLCLHALLGMQPAPAGCVQGNSFSGFRFIMAASCARSNYTRSACMHSSMLTQPHARGV